MSIGFLVEKSDDYMSIFFATDEVFVFRELAKEGSSGIWSDKVSLLHIKVTQRVGEHGGESIKTISRRCRRHKERQRRSVHVADNFGNKRINVLRNLAKHCFVMK